MADLLDILFLKPENPGRKRGQHFPLDPVRKSVHSHRLAFILMVGIALNVPLGRGRDGGRFHRPHRLRPLLHHLHTTTQKTEQNLDEERNEPNRNMMVINEWPF